MPATQTLGQLRSPQLATLGVRPLVCRSLSVCACVCLGVFVSACNCRARGGGFFSPVTACVADLAPAGRKRGAAVNHSVFVPVRLGGLGVFLPKPEFDLGDMR